MLRQAGGDKDNEILSKELMMKSLWSLLVSTKMKSSWDKWSNPNKRQLIQKTEGQIHKEWIAPADSAMICAELAHTVSTLSTKEFALIICRR